MFESLAFPTSCQRRLATEHEGSYRAPEENVYPMAIDGFGTDATMVGRIREDDSVPNGINMWIVADNLRKGAALNAVQIAEILIRDYL